MFFKLGAESLFPTNNMGIVVFARRHVDYGYIPKGLHTVVNKFSGNISALECILTYETLNIFRI